MNITYLVSIVLGVSLITLLVYFVIRQKKKIKRLQNEGLSLINRVKNLISNIQKHRGWSSAYARGDTSVLANIQALQLEIETITKGLESENKIKSFDRWAGYVEHWGRLSKNVLSLSSDNSFKQHTQLIGNMLYLLEDVAEKHFLTAEALPNFPMVSLLWRELLHVSECVGQSRALGTGVATVKVCNRVEKIRLGFLRQKITEMSEITYAQLKEYNRDQSSAELNILIEKSSKQTRYLCSVIEHELVDCEQIKLDAKNYFELATQAMNALNEIFEMELKKIEQNFQ